MSDPKLMLKQWLKDEITNILQFEIPDEMADFIISMKVNDVTEYLKNLLGSEDNETKKLITELMKRRSTLNNPISVGKKLIVDDQKFQVNNQKNRIIHYSEIGFDQQIRKSDSKNEISSAEQTTNSKKKNKFVNFYTKNGDTVLLKGRYICNCEAKKHKLINNCLTCGRIICEQEGSGPCYFCGSLVCTSEEQLVFNGDTGKASKLYEQLLMKEKPRGLDDALKQRDKLLDFDRNSRKHTHVFDDDSDYFCSTNPWLTLEERDKIKRKEEEFFNKKHGSRRNKKILLKVEGNKVTEEVEKDDLSLSRFEENMLKENQQLNTNYEILKSQNSVDHLIDPYFSKFNVKFKNKLKGNSSKFANSVGIPLSHIMDTEIHRLNDEGYCISIHQPFASFLVHSIRTVEGRTWYTPYRGKLWIASTGLRITRQDAVKYEDTYRLIKGEIKFPADYPPGCLLGCVDLVDCLTQEQYRIEFPDGEIEDPYVFVCEHFQVLPVRYPIKGNPNIYKLDEKIHKAAVTCLKTVDKILSESEHKVKLLRP